MCHNPHESCHISALVNLQTTDCFQFLGRIVMLLPQISNSQTVSLARPVSVAAGFAPGTVIQTEDGPLPVEHLFAGDRVAVQGGGYATLRGVTRVRALSSDVVVLAPGAAAGLTRTLTLAADHPTLLDDWRAQVVFGQAAILTPAQARVDGVLVRRERRAVQTLLQLEFDQPQAINANGLWLGCGTTRPQRSPVSRKLH